MENHSKRFLLFSDVDKQSNVFFFKFSSPFDTTKIGKRKKDLKNVKNFTFVFMHISFEYIHKHISFKYSCRRSVGIHSVLCKREYSITDDNGHSHPHTKRNKALSIQQPIDFDDKKRLCIVMRYTKLHSQRPTMGKKKFFFFSRVKTF